MASLEVGRFVHSWREWYKPVVSFRTLGSQISVALNLPGVEFVSKFYPTKPINSRYLQLMSTFQLPTGMLAKVVYNVVLWVPFSGVTCGNLLSFIWLESCASFGSITELNIVKLAEDSTAFAILHDDIWCMSLKWGGVLYMTIIGGQE